MLNHFSLVLLRWCRLEYLYIPIDKSQNPRGLDSSTTQLWDTEISQY